MIHILSRISNKGGALETIGLLKIEHEIIALIAVEAGREAKYIQDNDDVHWEKLENILEFFKSFLVHCHYEKEEKHLFDKLTERAAFEDANPASYILLEHKAVRQKLIAIERKLAESKHDDPGFYSELANDLNSLKELLDFQIYKENTVLLPLADRLLTESDKQELKRTFAMPNGNEGRGTREEKIDVLLRVLRIVDNYIL